VSGLTNAHSAATVMVGCGRWSTTRRLEALDSLLSNAEPIPKQARQNASPTHRVQREA
jgi:hypothetical protein